MNAPLARMLRPFAAPLAAAVALQALAGVASLVPWLALGRIAEHWRAAADLDGAARAWLAAAVAAGACWLGGQTLALHLTHRVDADLCDRLRARLADHLQRLPLNWFARTGSDRIARYVDQDVRALHQLVAHAPADITQLIVVPGAALACLLYLNPALLAFALVPLVLAAALFRWMRSARFMPAFAERRAALEALMGDYAELARNPALVRQYPGAGIEAVALDSVAGFARAFSAWVGRIGGLGACTQVLLGTPLLLAWVVLGAMGLVLARAPVGELCVFALLIWAVAAPVRALGHGADALRDARGRRAARCAARAAGAAAAARRRCAARAARRVDCDSRRVRRIRRRAGSARYRGDDRGRHDHRDRRAVRGRQEHAAHAARALHGSGARRGAPRRRGSAHAAAARAARADRGGVPARGRARRVDRREHRAVPARREPRRHPRGRARRVPRRSHRCAAGRLRLPLRSRRALSGGELQRLAIARALLSHAPLLLLDEPASALDPQTGRALRNALHGGARTRVIVSHDLAAVRQADQILVMDRGRIVERGTHRALLDARGLYARLWAERDRPAEEATR